MRLIGDGVGNYTGIAIDNDGNIILITEYYTLRNMRIVRFSENGKLLNSVENDSFKNQRALRKYSLYFPDKIACSNSNKLYVADLSTHIKVLNSNLEIIDIITVSKYGRDSRVICVACDDMGSIYAVKLNKTVIIQSPEGDQKILIEFDYNSDIRSVALDKGGLIYVSDGKNHCIKVYTTGGQLVKSFGREGHGPGMFDFPYGITVDDCGVVYVCDHRNGRLQLF